MARSRFGAGQVVLVPFPVPGREPVPHRIGLVLLSWPWADRGTHYLLCFIDTQSSTDPFELRLERNEIHGASVEHDLYVRPTYLMTISEGRIAAHLGTLNPDTLKSVLDVLFDAVYEEVEQTQD